MVTSDQPLVVVGGVCVTYSCIHKSYTLPVLDLLWYFASSLITGIQGLIVIVDLLIQCVKLDSKLWSIFLVPSSWQLLVHVYFIICSE